MSKRRLVYVPLEPYQERYTEYVSSVDGVVETQLKKYGVEFCSIRPDEQGLRRIKSGVVLDTLTRCTWAFRQVEELVRMMRNGELDSKRDVLYVEDFWHPGMEMLPYAMSTFKYSVPIYSFCYAQSVDPHDFTHSMAHWMRGFERAWANCHTKVFVMTKELKWMLVDGGVCEPDKVSVVGTVFDSEVLRRNASVPRCPRENWVVFSSRWDREKCPDFFCGLVKEVLRDRNDIRFIVCSGFEKLSSNQFRLLDLATEMQRSFWKNFEVHANLSKAEYYSILQRAKVQFNCADQDFVSYTLLDACTFGCLPLYPRYLTFPDALNHDERFLYEKGNIDSAKSKLLALLGLSPVPDVSFVYRKYEGSLYRMLGEMGFSV